MVSCSASNEVASNKRIQKRKYTKGYFFDFNKKLGGLKDSDQIANNQPKESTPIAEDERIESSNQEVVQVEETKTNVNETVSELNNSGEDLSKDSGSQNAVAAVDTDDQEKIKTPVKEVSGNNKNVSALSVKKARSNEKTVKKRIKQILENKSSDDVEFILLVILAILLPWLAVGIYTGWDVLLTLIAVLLWLFFWVPGIIFAFLVIFDVI